MYEDYQSSSYTALGAEAGYSRAISNKTSIAINTGVYFHKDMNQYSSESIQQVNVGAGIVYFPFRQEGGSENTFDFSVHLYAGFANLKSTITEKINGSDSGYSSSLSYSNSQTALSFRLIMRQPSSSRSIILTKSRTIFGQALASCSSFDS
jgi:hypothetical protein